MNKSINQELVFDERFSGGLGCLACRDRIVCGGLNTRNLFDCWPLCCDKPSSCDYACPRDVEKYVEHMMSIRKFEFDDIPRFQKLDYAPLPHSVPMIFNNCSNRQELLNTEFVAIPLVHLINLTTGEVRFNSRQELADHFGFSSDSKIVLSGVMEDVPLERYWYARNRKFIETLRLLSPVLVTSPNFSSFSNAPRWDNMFNLKRIAICWGELVEAGIPTALHMNARTPHDWKRWIDFINERTEIQSISFEFATLSVKRKSWYVAQLMELSEALSREIQLVIRGGNGFFAKLRNRFENLTVIDTSAFMKSTKRQMIQPSKKSISVASSDIYHIDGLLRHNVQMQSEIIDEEISPRNTSIS